MVDTPEIPAQKLHTNQLDVSPAFPSYLDEGCWDEKDVALFWRHRALNCIIAAASPPATWNSSPIIRATG
jgi:hypothetical protein